MGFSKLSHGGKNPAPVDRGFIVPSLSHYLQCFTVPLPCLWGKCSLSVWPTIMVKCIMAMLIYLHVLGTCLLLSVLCPWPGKDLFKLISGDQKAQPENHMSPAFG